MATSCNDGTFPLEYDDCVYSNSDETIQLRVKNQEDGKYIDLSGGENWLTIKCQQKYSADVIKEYLGSAEPPTPDGLDGGFVTFDLPSSDSKEVIGTSLTKVLVAEILHIDGVTRNRWPLTIGNFEYINGVRPT